MLCVEKNQNPRPSQVKEALPAVPGGSSPSSRGCREHHRVYCENSCPLDGLSPACCLPVILPGASIIYAATRASLKKWSGPLHYCKCAGRQLPPPGKRSTQAEKGPGNLVFSQQTCPVCLENMNEMQQASVNKAHTASVDGIQPWEENVMAFSTWALSPSTRPGALSGYEACGL